ncbi:AfsR/SARP family transcriptional regulator [Allostreptomyces psammosilenae]|uniref:DNA-binding SARP family transcriptional activator n=1 Tax=Allostreptomyces psammosilenae TaxID=1892865 RepID=A0A852ZRV7_9ACTN|nr:AfsR/SARP family transcriptional regulator [Allostreptomyces psammosilenae]NYI04197.1 DNA-binding SARP family transcriptional activator [Allostreptomyces psammosilenae]
MDISVLGSFTVRECGRNVVPTAAKPRKLLALLATHPDQLLSVRSILDELWGEDLPRSAMTTLQTYVLHVRNHIVSALVEAGRPASAAKAVLVTQARGYLLATHGGAVDLREYERLAAEGHRAVEAGRWAEASDRFRGALGLWRGPALVDVEAGPLLSVQVARLEESRLSVVAQMMEAELRIGRHHRVLDELAGLVEQHPTHESLHALYMLALYRAGRRDRALEVYARLRRVLDDTLGLEPLASVQRLHGDILNSHPGLDAPDAEGTAGEAGRDRDGAAVAALAVSGAGFRGVS